MKSTTVRKITYSALIAAVYTALTVATSFMSYGNIQFRIAEALCILPYFFPFTTWGLVAGCLLSNLFSPSGLLDVIFGTLATLIACLLTATIGSANRKRWWRRILACLMPVLVNALIVGGMLAFTLSADGSAAAGVLFPVFAAEVGAGEAAVLFVIGLPLMCLLPRARWFVKVSEKLRSAE